MKAPKHIFLFGLAAALVACESVSTFKATLVVPAAIQAEFSPTAPGLLLVDKRVVARLCGPTGADLEVPFERSVIGCPDVHSILAKAIRITSMDIEGYDEKERKLVTCGKTEPVDEGKTLDQTLGVFAQVNDLTRRPSVASVEGLLKASTNDCQESPATEGAVENPRLVLTKAPRLSDTPGPVQASPCDSCTEGQLCVATFDGTCASLGYRCLAKTDSCRRPVCSEACQAYACTQGSNGPTFVCNAPPCPGAPENAIACYGN